MKLLEFMMEDSGWGERGGGGGDRLAAE